MLNKNFKPIYFSLSLSLSLSKCDRITVVLMQFLEFCIQILDQHDFIFKKIKWTAIWI